MEMGRTMKHVELIIDYIVDGDDFQYCDNKGRLIRCKDCKYCDKGITISKSRTGNELVVNECIRFQKYVGENDYCSFAERKEK
jgi:hypothetical protein